MPVPDRRVGSVADGQLGGIGLDPVTTIATPHHDPRARLRSAGERRGCRVRISSGELGEERDRANGSAGYEAD